MTAAEQRPHAAQNDIEPKPLRHRESAPIRHSVLAIGAMRPLRVAHNRHYVPFVAPD